MPLDLAQVDWLYVILLAIFAALSTFLGGLLSFGRRGMAATLSAVLFAVLFIFWTYYPHRVPFLPRTITTTQVEVPAPDGPLGAKGIGESPVIAGAAAVANAIAAATGVRLRQLPMTRQRVWRALNAAPAGTDL